MSSAFEKQKWVLCQKPEVGDVLRWNEPLWAKPNKPRGKLDKIGEQQIIAEVIVRGKVLELKVLSLKKISAGDAPLKVKEGDQIRRKETTLEKSLCHKRLSSL